MVGDTVLESLAEAGLEPVEALFQGEATTAERARVGQIARQHAADISVGLGGGKILDVAKAVAVDAGLKMVTCPTIASNDSPTSAASVWYDEQGNFTGFDCWPFNPDIVLVDSQVIARGPVRAFVAGMGDALSTWVETEAACKTPGRQPRRRRAHHGRHGPGPALLRHAHGARPRGASATWSTRPSRPAVEKVIEANVLLSGLGFESGGLATAHMVGNLLSNVPECKRFMHGEKVGLRHHHPALPGRRDRRAATKRHRRFRDRRRPAGHVRRHQPGRRDPRSAGGDRQSCAGEGSLCHNHPFPVTADDVVDAMIAADALGRERRKAGGGR